MSYEGIRITDELDRAVQRTVRITPWRHETLGELVREIAAQRGAGLARGPNHKKVGTLPEEVTRQARLDTTSNCREQDCR
jgi:hypothetical protein